MTDLNQIVDIQISRTTEAVSRASFSIPCFIASHTRFSERAREYTSLTAVAEDFPSTSSAYIAAQRYFGQQLVPTKIVVGRRQVDGVDGSITTVANSTAYTITVNEVAATITSDGSATAGEIVAALKVAVDALAVTGLTFTDNLDGTFDLDITAGTAWSVTSTANITLANKAATETWADTIEAVQLANDSWYFLSVDSHVQADAEAIAAVIQTKKKLFGMSTAASAVRTSATTDVASVLKAAGYDRSFGLWNALADTAFPEAGWIGSQAQATPGSNTWAFKNIVGATPDKHTGTQSGYLAGKNISTYEALGGVNRTVGGKTFAGEFIDVMVLVDWTESRIQEGVWQVLANSTKVPYTNQGLSQIEAVIRRVHAEGVRNGGFDPDRPPVIIMPDATTVDSNLKATRTLEGVTFTFYLSGAVHTVAIRGTVAL